MSFRTMKEGLIPSKMDFRSLVSSMLGQDDPKLLHEIAEECCKKCGGPPGGCTCVEDVLAPASTDWMKWPSSVAIVISDTIARIRGAQRKASIAVHA